MKLTPEIISDIDKKAYQISFMMGNTWTPLGTDAIQGSQQYGFAKNPRYRQFVYLVPDTDSNVQKEAWKKELGEYLEAVSPGIVLAVLELLRETERKAKASQNEAQQWKANHECEVQRARVLKERPDMPLERVNAYNRMVALENENKALKDRMAGLQNLESLHAMVNTIHCQSSENMHLQREQMRYWQTHFKNPNGW